MTAEGINMNMKHDRYIQTHGRVCFVLGVIFIKMFPPGKKKCSDMKIVLRNVEGSCGQIMTANVALQTARTRTRKGIDQKKKYRIQATGTLIGNDCTGINS